MSDLLLVTGASSDIGMTLVREWLAGNGGSVLAHANRGVARLETLAAEFPGRVTPLVADLSDEVGTLALADAVLEQGVPTSVVHLPAPRLQYERFTKIKRVSFDADMAVQVHAAVALLGKLLPNMSKLPRARVVFLLSSVVHGVPPKYMAQYTVVKYAQLGLMRALAAEYAATPVRINAVSPSMVETQFLSDISELAIQGAAEANPLGRNAKPVDITGAIRFLLSPEADYISGVALPVTGGTAV
jgi:3-oxoacyl-[acyl-carrier protein] reductase